MPGGRGHVFGRRRGMRGRTGRKAMANSNIFGWIQSQFPPKNSFHRTVDSPSDTDYQGQTDELSQLKHRAESVQSQLKEINDRIYEIEKDPNSLFAYIDGAACRGCGRCEPICPQRAITLVDDIAQIDREKCTGCGICVPECPFGAIDLTG